MSLLFPKPTFFSTSREKVELWNRANIEVAAQCWCKPNNLILQAANYLFQLSMDTKWGGQAVNKATMLITLGTWYYLLTCLTIFSLSQIPITHRPISPSSSLPLSYQLFTTEYRSDSESIPTHKILYISSGQSLSQSRTVASITVWINAFSLDMYYYNNPSLLNTGGMMISLQPTYLHFVSYS